MGYFPDPNDPEVKQIMKDAAKKLEKSRERLHDKFRVERTDGSSEPGGKHENCRYFVLDLNHDEHAIPALVAYCKSCRSERPALANDLESLIDEIENDRDDNQEESPTFSCTLKQIMDADLWLEYCEEAGMSEWAVNEGLPNSTVVDLPLTSKVAQAMFIRATSR